MTKLEAAEAKRARRRARGQGAVPRQPSAREQAQQRQRHYERWTPALSSDRVEGRLAAALFAHILGGVTVVSDRPSVPVLPHTEEPG